MALDGDGAPADPGGFYNLFFGFAPPVEDPADLVFCFTGSSSRNKKVYDVDPDPGVAIFCLDLSEGGSGGSRSFR